MEEIIRSIILGIIQGLTEFLPVSSSGHLELAKFLLGEDSLPRESLLMTVVLHGATALSTLVIFRKDIAFIIRQLFRFQWNEETRFSLKILLSMIPAAFVGLFFEEYVEQLFNRQILLVGAMLAVTGLLLLFADRVQKTDRKVGYVDALLVGIAQAIAILPGISRSGATIASSVLLNIDRGRAARFSFLMVVPLILGKIAKDVLDGALTYQNEQFWPLLIGFGAAFISGLLACTWMIRIVKQSKLTYFAIYCFVVSILAIILVLV
jgi:undecaprenyl-diphosphatase